MIDAACRGFRKTVIGIMSVPLGLTYFSLEMAYAERLERELKNYTDPEVRAQKQAEYKRFMNTLEGPIDSIKGLYHSLNELNL